MRRRTRSADERFAGFMATARRRALPLRRSHRGRPGRIRVRRLDSGEACWYALSTFVLLLCCSNLSPRTAAAGAYRPPHARGTATPASYKREDEGGLAYNPTNGTNNFPSSGNGRTSPTFQSRGRRTIPGAATPDAAAPDADDGQSRRKKKEANKKKGRQDGSNANSGAATPVVEPPQPDPTPILAAAAAEVLSSDDKKRRALMKKLTAIDQLKVKKDNGEKLELTQYKKLERCAPVPRCWSARTDSHRNTQRGRDPQGAVGTRRWQVSGYPSLPWLPPRIFRCNSHTHHTRQTHSYSHRGSSVHRVSGALKRCCR